MAKKFVVSVADVQAMDENENILFKGITLIDSSLEMKLSMSEVKGGKGNALQYIYYHSPDLSIKISDCQWNLQYLSAAMGSSIVVGNNVFVEETIALVSGAGTTTAQPLAQQGDGSVLFGWVTDSANNTGTVVFTGKNFTYGSTSQTVCVRFYALNSASQSVTIPSTVIPKTVKLIMTARLASPDVSSTILGELQVLIPKASLDGNFSINLKADSVSTTAVNMKALAYRDPLGTGGCTNADYYARVTEIISSALWYSTVTGISILGGDRNLTHPGTLQLAVRVVTSDGLVFTPPMADLTFSSSVPAKATIGANTGLITSVATGATVISVTITAATSIDSSFTLTVV